MSTFFVSFSPANYATYNPAISTSNLRPIRTTYITAFWSTNSISFGETIENAQSTAVDTTFKTTNISAVIATSRLSDFGTDGKAYYAAITLSNYFTNYATIKTAISSTLCTTLH